MKHLHFITPLIFISLFFFQKASAQEKVVNLQQNVRVLKAWEKSSVLKLKSDKKNSLTLPFFDDFSSGDVFPSEKLWEDKFAFVNTDYPIDPVTVGVATLDAISYNGSMYDDAAYGSRFIADYLTSKPIDLSDADYQNVYLSFFYQPQGMGNSPESGDSLAVEFYSPETQQWERVWSKAGSTNLPFTQVYIAIDQAKYLQDKFQFRFLNYVSLAGAAIPGDAGNVDMWHIDYVQLDTDRNPDTDEIQDVAFLYPSQSLLIDYEAIPWTHFQENPTQKMKATLNTALKNNDTHTREIDTLKFYFNSLMNPTGSDLLKAGSHNINAGETYNFSAPFSYVYPTNGQDSALFDVKNVIITDDYDAKSNNTVSYFQKFYNYYAYDDGTAELGYGLTGEGSRNGSVAYKFTTYKKDSLRAVQIYFNQTLNEANRKYFYLSIWDDDNGKPGSLIYEKIGIRPQYTDELNQFYSYRLKAYEYDERDTAIAVQGTFYVGWKQTTEDMFNVGFDVNRNSQDKLFYSIDGTWQASLSSGALMMRPVFGKKLPQITAIEPVKKSVFRIYPNPTSDRVYIEMPNDTKLSNCKLTIYNLFGKQIRQDKNFENKWLDVSNLASGVYLLYFKSERFFETKRLVID